jgi:hypothetical protein
MYQATLCHLPRAAYRFDGGLSQLACDSRRNNQQQHAG